MVATVGSISIDLATNSVQFANGFRNSATTVERESNRMGKAVKRVDVAMAGLGGVVKGAVGALAGFAAISSGVRAFITNTIEAEKVTRQLEAAIVSTGGAAGLSVRELQAMASGFQNVTTYGDEAIQQMQAVLLTFTKIKGNVFRDATEAVLNLATRMGTDLGGAALQVGKALNDPIKGVTSLTRAGVQFSEEQKRMIASMVRTNNLAGAQKIILKELETQFGGAARAARDSLGGALQGLSNAWGDLFEISGPAAEKVRGSIDSLTEKISSPEFKEAVNTLGSTLFRALGAIAEAAEKAADEINRIQSEIDEFKKSGTTKDFLDILGIRIEEGGVADKVGEFFTEMAASATRSAADITAEIQKLEAEIFDLIQYGNEFDLFDAQKIADHVATLKDQLADIEAAAVSAANAIRADFAEAFRAAEIASMKAMEQFNQQRYGPPGERREAPEGYTRKVDEATGIGVTRLNVDDENAERTAAATEKLVDNMPTWLDELGGEFDASIQSVNDLLASGVFFDYASIADAVRTGIVSGMAQERQQYSISTTNPIQKQIEELQEMLEVAGSVAARGIREQIRELELQLYLTKQGRELGGIGGVGGRNIAYAGKFAEGGSFVVPGAPSGDKTRVTLDANGGERVTVSPAGESARPPIIINQTYQPAPGETERTTRQNMRNMTIEAFREVGRI